MKKMNVIQVLQLFGRANRMRLEYPYYRLGQSLFNALNQLCPALAETIRGSDSDPFYDDSKINQFINQIYTP